MAYTTTEPTSETLAPAVPAVPAQPMTPDPRPGPGERDLAVLESAREVVARGWVQHEWYRTAPRSLRDRLFGPMPGPDQLDAACLVAAVAVAGHAGGVFTHVDRDSGSALDRVWDALREARGHAETGHTATGHTETGPAAVAPVLRRARLRELVRWNDAPDRTREEVLGVLDRAISRTILQQVR